jgi:hypothetical protein
MEEVSAFRQERKMKITFEQFLSRVDEKYLESRSVLRYGQTVMNILYEVWPEKHHEVMSSDDDCFYDDSATKMTLEKLERDWKNES